MKRAVLPVGNIDARSRSRDVSAFDAITRARPLAPPRLALRDYVQRPGEIEARREAAREAGIVPARPPKPPRPKPLPIREEIEISPPEG
jgi:hypothetical protein